MRVGIVHTAGSPCGCAEAISGGLRELGHEAVVIDAAEVPARARRLAGECDFLFDHTDTFLGRGDLRACVRFLLEARGARVAGSPSWAGALCDDKAQTRWLLEDARVPVPPGTVIESPADALPDDLAAPLVVKPAGEHMSRGLSVERSREAALARARDLLRERGQPVVVERFVEGRELAVSVLADAGGVPEVLPILEWRTGGGVLTAEHKLREGADRAKDAVRADLPPALAARIDRLARRAFRGLALRDYARFDVRLAPDGTPYFLEANTKPSLEREEALARSASWAGLDYPSLLARILAAAGGYHGRRVTVEGLPGGPLDVDVRGANWANVPADPPADSSIELARLLDVGGGETVLDLGTGTGLLALAALRKGAVRVTATEREEVALGWTEWNLAKSRVGNRVRLRRGPWFDAVEGEGPFDVIVATPPQTPGPFPFGPRYGGPDGAEHLAHLVGGAGRFLSPGGRLWLLALSIAHPARVRALLDRHFAEVALVKETDRPFTDAEMEDRCPGLPAWLRALRERGMAEFEDRPGGGVFRNRYWRASRPR